MNMKSKTEENTLIEKFDLISMLLEESSHLKYEKFSLLM